MSSMLVQTSHDARIPMFCHRLHVQLYPTFTATPTTVSSPITFRAGSSAASAAALYVQQRLPLKADRFLAGTTLSRQSRTGRPIKVHPCPKSIVTTHPKAVAC